MNATSLLFLGCLLTYMHHFQVLSLSCIKCSPADPGCASGSILPTPCSPEAQSCFKHKVYIVNGGQGTYRGCSRDPMGGEGSEGCRSIIVRGRNAVICSRLCDWEACNNS